jgi:hypothetical protein
MIEGDVIADFWVYPLRWGDTITNYEWMPFHIDKFLDSSMLAEAIAEDRRGDVLTAVMLWCKAMKQDPAGTLPDDDVQLAQMAGFGADVAAWRAVRAGALRGWVPVIIEGEKPGAKPRLGHPFIEPLAVKAMGRKLGRQQSREANDLAVKRSRVKSKLIALGNSRMAQNGGVLDAITGWLVQHELFITDDNVRAAMEACAGVPRLVK